MYSHVVRHVGECDARDDEAHAGLTVYFVDAFEHGADFSFGTGIVVTISQNPCADTGDGLGDALELDERRRAVVAVDLDFKCVFAGNRWRHRHLRASGRGERHGPRPRHMPHDVAVRDEAGRLDDDSELGLTP